MNPSEKIYDVAVIGGGIAGAGIARDAAMRGLSVVLFEKNTFGSGTSGKSSKLIHGGIRYLETAWKALKRGHFDDFSKNLRFVYHALREAQTLEKIAPDLVRPLPLLIPIYQKKGRSPLSVYFGVLVYYCLALLSGGARRPRIYPSRAAALRQMPQLRADGLSGAVMIWDRVTDDVALVRKTLDSAVRHGAVVFEQAKFLNIHPNPSTQVHTVDILRNGGRQIFKARKVVDATGAWIDETRKLTGEYDHDLLSPVAGCHIHLEKFLPMSVLLQAKDDRIFFCIDLGDTARIGTTERTHRDPDHVAATEDEIAYLFKSLAFYFPGIPFREADILSSDAGIRPLARPRKNTPQNEISREHQFHVGPTGIIHVLGVKLTDYRRAGKDLLDQLYPELVRFTPSMRRDSRTGCEPL